MARWLFKEEPAHYSFADLERDGQALWEGVANPLARQHLRKVRRGDTILYYHTGKEKAIVGLMRALADAGPDPNDKDPKAVAVMVEPERRLAHPVTLEQIKKDPLLTTWELVRLPRLSVMPVTDVQWRRVLEASKEAE